MAATVFPPPAGSERSAPGPTRLTVPLALAVWFVLVVSLGAGGAFIVPPSSPPIPIAAAVALPLLLFFAALRLSPAFRDFVLTLDLRLIAGMQAWRWAGFGFLALYAHKILPGIFALPAGLGDMAIGVTAPWVLLALVRQPAFAASAAFRRWNVLGILDLIVAVSLGTSNAILSTGAPGEITSAPMATLPLLLIPAFLVPLFLMLHTAALMQGRQLARARAAAR